MNRESGSTLPLLIGLAALALSLALGLAESASLQVTKTRSVADARFAVLAAAKTQAPPVLNFDYGPSLRALLPEPSTLEVFTRDGKTFEAKVCYLWHSPLSLRPDEPVCASAKARFVPA